jgi:hypothetical protein
MEKILQEVSTQKAMFAEAARYTQSENLCWSWMKSI